LILAYSPVFGANVGYLAILVEQQLVMDRHRVTQCKHHAVKIADRTHSFWDVLLWQGAR